MIVYEEFKGFLDPEEDRSILLSAYNKPLTAALFVERHQQWKDKMEERGKEPIYTLGERELEGKPSAYQIYMHSADEYEAAMKLVGSLYHWDELCKKTWFIEELAIWRLHMAKRDISLAKKTILRDVKNSDGPAARKLLEIAQKTLTPPRSKTTKPEAPASDIDALYNQYMQ